MMPRGWTAGRGPGLEGAPALGGPTEPVPACLSSLRVQGDSGSFSLADCLSSMDVGAGPLEIDKMICGIFSSAGRSTRRP